MCKHKLPAIIEDIYFAGWEVVCSKCKKVFKTPIEIQDYLNMGGSIRNTSLIAVILGERKKI